MAERALQKRGALAGIIASAAVGLIIALAGAFFAGYALGRTAGSVVESQVQQSPDGDASAPGNSDVCGSWEGDIAGAEPGAVRLNLQTAQNLGGYDGCNQGGGSWKLEGSTVRFSELRSTRMACAGIEDPYLFRATAGEVSDDGSIMELYDAQGEAIGTLRRVPTAEGN